MGEGSLSFPSNASLASTYLYRCGATIALVYIAKRYNNCAPLCRFLLLATIPILIASLFVLVVANVAQLSTVLHAVLSTISVIIYFCCFVMGFGPIPNILCAEIFPTSVRGVCIAICALTFWAGDIIVTYTLPVMLTAIGLAGVFGIYAVVCVFAFIFVFLKVPETKGMPLEVITEFFAVGAKRAQAAKSSSAVLG